jgi:hypothetical protein
MVNELVNKIAEFVRNPSTLTDHDRLEQIASVAMHAGYSVELLRFAELLEPIARHNRPEKAKHERGKHHE